MNENGYTYIWNYVASTVESREMKGEIAMEIPEINDKINQLLKESEEQNMGKKTGENIINEADNKLNEAKEKFAGALNSISEVLGFSLLKSSVAELIEASMDNASSTMSISVMAKKCREMIDKEIDNLKFWGDQDSLRKAAQLKALTEDDRGKCIFESFASVTVCIINKVSDKLKFDDSDKKSFIKSVCKGISAFMKVVKAGIKILWSATKYVASFVISGAIIIGNWIYESIKTAVEKLKCWAEKKDEIIEADTDDEEEGDGVFGTNLA